MMMSVKPKRYAKPYCCQRLYKLLRLINSVYFSLSQILPSHMIKTVSVIMVIPSANLGKLKNCMNSGAIGKVLIMKITGVILYTPMIGAVSAARRISFLRYFLEEFVNSSCRGKPINQSAS